MSNCGARRVPPAHSFPSSAPLSTPPPAALAPYPHNSSNLHDETERERGFVRSSSCITRGNVILFAVQLFLLVAHMCHLKNVSGSFLLKGGEEVEKKNEQVDRLSSSVSTARVTTTTSTRQDEHENHDESMSSGGSWILGAQTLEETLSKSQEKTEEVIQSSTIMAQCPPVQQVVKCQDMNHPNPTQNHSTTTLSCSQCASPQWGPLTYHAPQNHTNHTTTNHDQKIYLPLLVPPGYGSSILSAILASSPTVSSMCKPAPDFKIPHIPWMCEPTTLLVKHGIFPYSRRWEPHGTNFTKVYDFYHRNSTNTVWKHPSRPILMDKSPPNIAKIQDLMDYYHTHHLQYRAIVMWRHPCRRDWSHGHGVSGTERLAKNLQGKMHYEQYMRDVLEYIPARNRFHVNYDDLLLRPGLVLQRLVEWFPELEVLSVEGGLRGRRRKKRAGGRGKKKVLKVRQEEELEEFERVQEELWSQSQTLSQTQTPSQAHDKHDRIQTQPPPPPPPQNNRHHHHSRQLLGLSASNLKKYVFPPPEELNLCKLYHEMDQVPQQELDLWEEFMAHAP